jgi:hypothetical protein
MSDNVEKSYKYKQKFLFYRKYRSNVINIFCIPAIVWSMYGLANTFGKNIGIPQVLYYKYIPSITIYTIYMIYYYLIAPKKIFWSTVYFYLAILIESNRTYNINNNYNIFVFVQTFSWILLILVDTLCKGNKAMKYEDNVQVFANIPLFIVHTFKHYIPYMDIGVISILFILYRYRVLYS